MQNRFAEQNADGDKVDIPIAAQRDYHLSPPSTNPYNAYISRQNLLQR